MSENVGASTSINPKGLHGLKGDNFTLHLPRERPYVRLFDPLKNFTVSFEQADHLSCLSPLRRETENVEEYSLIAFALLR
jgi:hypothetical protein